MTEFIRSVYKGESVLITGHTGFKGSWLSIWLHALGSRVTGYALDPKTERDNFVLTGIGEKIRDIRGNINDRKDLLDVFRETEPKIVFHLAAQPLVLEGYRDPVSTYETNIMGTVNVLEAIRQTPSVQAAVIVTSDKVYENREWSWPYRETDALGGYDPYSSSKGACEIVVAAYRRSFLEVLGKKTATVRAGNVIGGGDWADDRILPDIIRALEKNRSVSVRNPEAVRPWQHVLEPLGGYLLLGAKMLKGKGEFAGAWNFGPGPENIIPVRDLVEMSIHEYGKGRWKNISRKEALHEAGFLSLDNSKARYGLGWKPVWNINVTSEKTIAWYRKYTEENVLKLCLEQIGQYSKQWK